MDLTDSSDSPPNWQFDMSKYLSLTRTNNRNFDIAKADSVNDVCKYRAAPLFTREVYRRVVATQLSCREILQGKVYPQFALLGSLQDEDPDRASEADLEVEPLDKLVFTNMSEPWSAFICGSQGSDKSHTLSCLLEDALMVSPDLGVLKKPLVSMVFHWDTFSNYGNGQICEAAYLSSARVPVRVLVAPTSLERKKRQYRNLPGAPESSPKPRVFPLYLRQDQISIDILMTLMAVSETGSSVPLYISTIFNKVKDKVTNEQQNPVIDWEAFMSKIPSLGLTDTQLAPLNQRLELLHTILLDKEQSAEVLKEQRRPGIPGLVH